MKFNHILMSGLCLLGLGFVSCDDQDDASYTPAEAQPSVPVYMATDMNTAFKVGETATEISFPVYRSETDATATYPITITSNHAELFNLPTSVEFAAGEGMTEAVISFDATKLSGSETYTFDVTVGDGVNTPYWLEKASLTLNYQPWVDVVGPNGEEYATYTDGFVDSWFTLTPAVLPYQVKLQMSPAVKGLYRLVNPYGAAFPYNQPGDYDDSTDRYMYFNCANPNACFICDSEGRANNGSTMAVFNTGMNWGYGEFIFTGVYNIRAAQGNMSAAAPNAGTLKDGCLTFPEKALLARMDEYTEPGSWNYANTKGNFRLLWPGAKEPEPEVEWEAIGTAQYTDVLICPMFGEPATTWEVEVEQNINEPGLFRMVNPYKDGVMTDGWPYEGDKYIEIDATEPNCVYIEMQQIFEYPESPVDGAIMMTNLANNFKLGGSTPEDIIGEGYNDVYDEANLTFTFGAGHLRMYMPNTSNTDWQSKLITFDAKTPGKLVLSSTASNNAKINAAAAMNYTGVFKRALKKHVPMFSDSKARRVVKAKHAKSVLELAR